LHNPESRPKGFIASLSTPFVATMSESDPTPTGVLLYGVVDVRVYSEKLDRAVIAYRLDGDTRLVRVPLHRLHALQLAGSDPDLDGSEPGHLRLRAPRPPAPPTPVSLELLPALLASKELSTIVERVLCGDLDASAARDLVESLGHDAGGRRLSDLEEGLAAAVLRHPRALALVRHVGSLEVMWTEVSARDAVAMTAALDISDVCSVACLALVQLVLGSSGHLPPRTVHSTRSLIACPITPPPTDHAVGASILGAQPSVCSAGVVGSVGRGSVGGGRVSGTASHSTAPCVCVCLLRSPALACVPDCV
jgi:hypothetical protein